MWWYKCEEKEGSDAVVGAGVRVLSSWDFVSLIKDFGRFVTACVGLVEDSQETYLCRSTSSLSVSHNGEEIVPVDKC